MKIADLKKKIYRWRYWLIAVGAGVTALTLVLPEVGFLEWVSMIPGIAAFMSICDGDKLKFRKIYWYGAFYFGVFYLVNFHWFIYMYPLEFLGVSRFSAVILVILCWVGLSAFQTVFSAFLFPTAFYLCRLRSVRRHGFLRPVIVACAFAAFEWGQNLGSLGVPWCKLCLGQINYLPVLQSASLFGSCFVSFLIVFVNAVTVYALLYADKKRVWSAVALGSFSLNLIAGVIMLYSYSDCGDPVSVAGIQGNISSQDKWSGSSYQISIDAYKCQTENAAEAGAEIVVWPETALPRIYSEGGEADVTLSELAKQYGITLYAGIFTREDSDKFNTLLQFNPDGSLSETRYNKRHLVPFGEYIPAKEVFKVVLPIITSLCKTELVRGDSPEIFETEYGKIGALICFDSIYDELARDSVNSGAELLIVSTNDSWFGHSAAVYMHNAQSRIRAIENRRYVVRSANTGYSTVISPTGQIVSDTQIQTESYVIGDVYFRSDSTLYAKIGNVFVYFCLIFLAFLPFNDAIARKRRFSRKL